MKNILKENAKTMFQIIDKEIERVAKIKNSNRAKVLAKLEFAQWLLDSVPQETVFVVEGCKGDNERGYQLPNIGSLVECIVKWHFHHTETVAKEFNAEMVDHKQGCIAYEIKASLGSNSLATPSENETTILVNRVGVWSIGKKDVQKYTNKQGRLPFNQECGKPFTKLMEVLGYEM